MMGNGHEDQLSKTMPERHSYILTEVADLEESAAPFLVTL